MVYHLQVAKGVAHLHAQHVYHGDLKPDNILLDEVGKAKICDFGLSRVRTMIYGGSVETEFERVGGTHAWMAPEQLADLQAFRAPLPRGPSDGTCGSRIVRLSAFIDIILIVSHPVYALGKIIWAVLSSPVPLADQSHLLVAAKPLLEWCMLHTPAARPSAAEVVEQLYCLLRRVTTTDIAVGVPSVAAREPGLCDFLPVPAHDPRHVVCAFDRELASRLPRVTTDSHMRVVLVSGSAGRGKSSAARAIYTDDAYPGGVLWMNSETRTSLDSGFRSLLVQMGNDACAMGDIHTALRTVKDVMGDCQRKRFLLVFDNADTDDMLSCLATRYFPSIVSHCDVLITTRWPAVKRPTSLSMAITVVAPKLSPEEALRILLKRVSATSYDACKEDIDVAVSVSSGSVCIESWRRLLGDPTLLPADADQEREAAISIIGRGVLDHHPLSIAQAAAFVARAPNPRERRFSNCLDLLRGRLLEMLQEPLAGTDSDPAHRSVLASLRVSHSRLSVSARHVLRIASMCDPDDIPKDILEDVARASGGPELFRTPEIAVAAIEELCDASLLTECIRSGYFSMHRLQKVAAMEVSGINNVVTAPSSEAAAFAVVFIPLLQEEWVCIKASPSVERASASLPHARAICELTARYSRHKNWFAELLIIVSKRLADQGDDELAARLCTEELAARVQIGNTDIEQFARMAMYLCVKRGKPREGLEAISVLLDPRLRHAIEARELPSAELLDAQLPLVCNNIACALRQLGMLREALAWARSALDRRRRALSAALPASSDVAPLLVKGIRSGVREAKDLLRSLNSVGGILAAAGSLDSLDESMLLFDEAELGARALGTGNSELYDVLAGRATALRAIAAFEGSSPEVRTTALTRACELCNEVLSGYRRLFSGHHVFVASAVNELAGLLEGQGEIADAVVLRRGLLVEMRIAFDSGRCGKANVVTAELNLGQSLRIQRDPMCDYEAAEIEKALDAPLAEAAPSASSCRFGGAHCMTRLPPYKAGSRQCESCGLGPALSAMLLCAACGYAECARCHWHALRR